MAAVVKSPASKLQSAKDRGKKYLADLKMVKKLQAMDRKELKKLGITAGVSAVAGGIAGYTIEQKIQEKPEDELSSESFLKKGAMGLPATTILAGAAAVIAAKKLKGTKSVIAAAALGGAAAGGYAYKKANEEEK